jgi:hypothetical protein
MAINLLKLFEDITDRVEAYTKEQHAHIFEDD